MVAVSSEERVATERAQGIVLVPALLLYHIAALEYPAVEPFIFRRKYMERTAAFLQKIVVDNDIVEEIPRILIAESAVTGLVEIPHRIEISAGLNLRSLLLRSQSLREALVVGIVIHVSHNHYLDIRVHRLERVGIAAHCLGAAHPQILRSGRASTAGRPVVDHETEPLTLYRTAYGQYVTGLEIRNLGYHRLENVAPLQLEHVRTEEQGHIYAPGLGRVIVNYLITGRTQSLRRDQILQHPAVLHLGETDDCRPGLVGSRNPVQYLGDIGQLLVVLGLCPFLGTVGSEFLVPGKKFSTL